MGHRGRASLCRGIRMGSTIAQRSGWVWLRNWFIEELCYDQILLVQVLSRDVGSLHNKFPAIRKERFYSQRIHRLWDSVLSAEFPGGLPGSLDLLTFSADHHPPVLSLDR